MAITSSGLYAPTIIKILDDTAGVALGSETLVKGMLVTDSYTHDYDVHDFRDDATTWEAPATGNYTTGGRVNASTTLTAATPSTGIVRFDHEDATWASSTITDVMAMIDYLEVGADSADMLLCLLDFVTAVSTTNGLLTVQIATNGVFTVDHVP